MCASEWARSARREPQRAPEEVKRKPQHAQQEPEFVLVRAAIALWHAENRQALCNTELGVRVSLTEHPTGSQPRACQQHAAALPAATRAPVGAATTKMRVLLLFLCCDAPSMVDDSTQIPGGSAQPLWLPSTLQQKAGGSAGSSSDGSDSGAAQVCSCRLEACRHAFSPEV